MTPDSQEQLWIRRFAKLDAKLTDHFGKLAKPSPDFDRRLLERIGQTSRPIDFHKFRRP